MAYDVDMGTSQDQDGAQQPRRIDLEAGRRAFLRSCGLAAAGASLIGLGSTTANAAALTDTQILNFALNLEYLEAEFYLFAVNGTGLPSNLTTGQGTQGTVTYGAAKVPFSNTLVADYAAEIANDELTHVKFLRSALGSSAIAEPSINIKGAFKNAAIAAGIIPTGGSFDAYANDITFLLAAYIFEDVGVTAYHGAAALISDKSILTAAAGILAVEAYHAGLIRTILFGEQMMNSSSDIIKDTRLISALRANLAKVNSSDPPDDQGIGSNQSIINGGTQTPSNIVPTDANGLAFARTPSQVLNIVYGAQGATQGLFFPGGVNPGPSS